MKYILTIILIIILLSGCREETPDQPKQNLPPQTHVFVEYADTLNYTSSVRSISWYGDDPDGFVTGYYFTWKTNPGTDDWEFTELRQKVFPLLIEGLDTIYTFQVKAVDDEGMEDPTPAMQRFPIKNTPPEIAWIDALAVPDTSLTVITLFWTVSDLDGDSTISYYEFALDDTISGWRKYPGDFPQYLTMNADSGLTPGDHAFYLRAIDRAGAKSKTIRMPADEDKYFYIQEPVGDLLLIDDFTRPEADVFYKSVLDTLAVDYTVWDLKANAPPSVIPFTESLKLFKYVVWYADLTPHLTEAQSALPFYRTPSVKGKILFSMQFNTNMSAAQSNPLDFSPIASIDQYFNRISTGKIFYPDPNDSYVNSLNFEELKVSRTEFGVSSLVPKDNAKILFRYQNTDSLHTDPVLAVIGENDNTGEKDFVFVAFPIHSLNGNGNAGSFISRVFRKIFEYQK